MSRFIQAISLFAVVSFSLECESNMFCEESLPVTWCEEIDQVDTSIENCTATVHMPFYSQCGFSIQRHYHTIYALYVSLKITSGSLGVRMGIDGRDGIGLDLNQNAITYGWNDGSWKSIVLQSPIASDQWYNVKITVIDDVITIYIDNFDTYSYQKSGITYESLHYGMWANPSSYGQATCLHINGTLVSIKDTVNSTPAIDGDENTIIWIVGSIIAAILCVVVVVLFYRRLKPKLEPKHNVPISMENTRNTIKQKDEITLTTALDSTTNGAQFEYKNVAPSAPEIVSNHNENHEVVLSEAVVGKQMKRTHLISGESEGVNGAAEERVRVEQWLDTDVGYVEYYNLFIENGFDKLSTIKNSGVTSEVLAEMGIDKLGHRMAILSAIQRM